MTESLAITWAVVLTMLVLCVALGFFVGQQSRRS